jgi:hypothetical protein
MAPGNDLSHRVSAVRAAGQQLFIHPLKHFKGFAASGARLFIVRGLVFVNRHNVVFSLF